MPASTSSTWLCEASEIGLPPETRPRWISLEQHALLPQSASAMLCLHPRKALVGPKFFLIYIHIFVQCFKSFIQRLFVCRQQLGRSQSHAIIPVLQVGLPRGIRPCLLQMHDMCSQYDMANMKSELARINRTTLTTAAAWRRHALQFRPWQHVFSHRQSRPRRYKHGRIRRTFSRRRSRRPARSSGPEFKMLSGNQPLKKSWPSRSCASWWQTSTMTRQKPGLLQRSDCQSGAGTCVRRAWFSCGMPWSRHCSGSFSWWFWT